LTRFKPSKVNPPRLPSANHATNHTGTPSSPRLNGPTPASKRHGAGWRPLEPSGRGKPPRQPRARGEDATPRRPGTAVAPLGQVTRAGEGPRPREARRPRTRPRRRRSGSASPGAARSLCPRRRGPDGWRQRRARARVVPRHPGPGPVGGASRRRAPGASRTGPGDGDALPRAGRAPERQIRCGGGRRQLLLGTGRPSRG
jgi:hypothetical protein